MRLRCSLALWGFWHGVLALILPQYDAQGPMLLELAQTREPAFDYVILAFTKVDDPKTYRAEVPLGVRIPSGKNQFRVEIDSGSCVLIPRSRCEPTNARKHSEDRDGRKQVRASQAVGRSGSYRVSSCTNAE